MLLPTNVDYDGIYVDARKYLFPFTDACRFTCMYFSLFGSFGPEIRQLASHIRLTLRN